MARAKNPETEKRFVVFQDISHFMLHECPTCIVQIQLHGVVHDTPSQNLEQCTVNNAPVHFLWPKKHRFHFVNMYDSGLCHVFTTIQNVCFSTSVFMVSMQKNENWYVRGKITSHTFNYK